MPIIFPFVSRKPQQVQGQGYQSYGAANVLADENFTIQGAPEPAFPQGSVPHRPSRMPIANMGTFVFSNSGMLGDFIPYAHELLNVHAPNNDGQKRLVGRSGINSERVNIRKPPAIAYGSFFELTKGY